MLNKHPHLLITERELIRECIAGNRAMQNQLYQTFAANMMGICVRYAKNRQDAEEILQEGFIKVFRHLQKYRYEGSLEGWIKTIIIHCAIEKLRSQHRMYPVIGIEESAACLADEEVILDALHTKDLIRLIQQLPVMCRLVFGKFMQDTDPICILTYTIRKRSNHCKG